MVLFEMLTWLALGALVALTPRARREWSRHSWPYVVVVAAAAFLGGALGSMAVSQPLVLGGYRFGSLMVAAIFAFGARTLCAAVAHTRPAHRH
jgi:hypothetical protein